MSSMVPGDQNTPKKAKPETFKDFLRSMNDFFQEKPVKGLLQSMDEFFNTPFPGGGFHVEKRENGEEYLILAELPGIKREQIQLKAVNNYLIITVENNELTTKEDQANHTFHRRVSQQRTSRTISFPHPINEKTIRASYRDGLLEIRLPQEKAKIINIED
jgi:HSP20 family protein